MTDETVAPANDLGAGEERRSSTWLVSANVARYGAQTLVVAAAAKFFSAGDAGTLALAMAITAPIFVVSNLGLRNLYVTLDPPVSFADYVSVRRSWTGLALALAAASAFVVAGASPLILVLVAVGKAFDGISDFYIAVYQVGRRSRSVAVAFLVQVVVTVVGGACAIQADLSFPTFIALALVASSAATQLYFWLGDPARWRQFFLRLSGASSRSARGRLVRAGLPVGLSSGVVALNVAMPQYAMRASAGEADLARYVFITYVPVAVELLLNPLSQAWLPKARAGKALWTSSVGAAVAVARRWTLITAPLGFVALGAAVLVLPHVLGEFFRYGVVTMTWVAASILMLPLVFAAMTTLTVLNRYREALAVNVTSVVVAGVVAWTFVPSVGIDGGVAALALSQAVRCGLGLWFLARRGAVPRLVSTVEQGGRS